MEIDIKELTSGKFDGKDIWVCDYRRPDISKKPIRNLKPQLVRVFSNDDLPKNKRVYYSDSHLRPLLKSGAPSSAIMQVYDNTGYRSYTGVPLCAYTEKGECLQKFKDQVKEVINVFEEKKRVAIEEIQSEIDGLNKLF